MENGGGHPARWPFPSGPLCQPLHGHAHPRVFKTLGCLKKAVVTRQTHFHAQNLLSNFCIYLISLKLSTSRQSST